LAEAYALYLRKERALASTTIEGYLGFVQRFLADVIGAGDADFSNLRATEIFSFVRRDADRCPKRAKLMVTSLKSFLRYLRYQGYIAVDLAVAVPTVSRWRLTNIPRSLSSEQVELVLSSTKARAELRDYVDIPLRSAVSTGAPRPLVMRPIGLSLRSDDGISFYGTDLRAVSSF
jgi:site-specific recombinase XerD